MKIVLKAAALLAMLLAFQHVAAQESSYKVVEGERGRGFGNTYTEIIAVDETGYYLSHKSAYNSIEHVSNDLKVDKCNLVALPLGVKTRAAFKLVYLDDRLVLFSSMVDRKLNTHTLFMETIDKETLESDNDITALAEVYSEEKQASASFGIEISPDYSKVMIYAKLPGKKDKAPEYNIQVFDSEMDRLWAKDITLPDSLKSLAIESYHVDNEGEVIFSAEYVINSEPDGEKYGKDILLRYMSDMDEAAVYEIKLDNKSVLHKKVTFDKDANILCAGSYSNRKGDTTGIFSLSIDRKTGEILHQSLKELDINFITSGMRKRLKRRAERMARKGRIIELMYLYVPDHLVIKDDGSAVLIAQPTYAYLLSSSSGNSSMVYVAYDIMVTNIGADGKIEWVTKINKCQETKDDDGVTISYTAALVNNHLYFVFNDDMRNMISEPMQPNSYSKYVYVGKREVTVVVEVDEQGNQNRTQILSEEQGHISVCPRASGQVGPSSILLHNINRGEHRTRGFKAVGMLFNGHKAEYQYKRLDINSTTDADTE